MSKGSPQDSAFATHVIQSDAESHFNVELSLPVEPAPEMAPAMAFVRIDVSQLLGRAYGGGFASIDLPVACLEDVAANLACVVTFARRQGWLPAEGA